MLLKIANRLELKPGIGKLGAACQQIFLYLGRVDIHLDTARDVSNRGDTYRKCSK